MGMFIEAFNRPTEAYRRRSGHIAWVFVIAAVLFVTVFDQITNYYANIGNFDVAIDPLKMLYLAGAGIATYLVACMVLWAICRAFGSKTQLPVYFKTWGISYIPTAFCALAVSLSETYFYVFWNNSLWGLLLSIAFIAILIWKIILYVVFLRETIGLKGKKFAGAFILCAVVFLALAMAGMRIGLKSPIL
jgi:hypothetical protein